MKFEFTNTILYSDEEGSLRAKVLIDEENETMWIIQKELCELLDIDENTLECHLNYLFKTGEIDKDSSTAILKMYLPNGENYQTKAYNLDVIISIAYKIKSNKAIKFRRWLIKSLREYILKGFVLNDELLKNG